MTLIEKIGVNIRKYRDIKKMTQARLSKESGVTITLIAWLERNSKTNTSIKTLERLAEAFNISVIDLLK